jgi:hypothetical protein
MATMKEAIKRLHTIHNACVPKDKDNDTAGLDEFTRIKKQISQNVKQCREVRRIFPCHAPRGLT